MNDTRTASKSKEAYEQLKIKLQSGQLGPGERLSEAQVAKALSMSRTPVRQAIARLEAEGLLISAGAQGSKYVRYIEDEDPQEVLAHYELREFIEGMAARLASMNMTGWQIEGLKACEQDIEESIRSGDRERIDRSGAEFHRYLLANCGNQLVYQVWEAYHLTPLSHRSAAFEEEIGVHLPQDFPRAEAWKAAVDAIAAHDPDEAERSMRKPIREYTAAIRKLLWSKSGSS